MPLDLRKVFSFGVALLLMAFCACARAQVNAGVAEIQFGMSQAEVQFVVNSHHAYTSTEPGAGVFSEVTDLADKKAFTVLFQFDGASGGLTRVNIYSKEPLQSKTWRARILSLSKIGMFNNGVCFPGGVHAFVEPGPGPDFTTLAIERSVRTQGPCGDGRVSFSSDITFPTYFSWNHNGQNLEGRQVGNTDKSLEIQNSDLDKMLDRIVSDASRRWFANTYKPGSIYNVVSIGSGASTFAKANFYYGTGNQGGLEVEIANGTVKCLAFYDMNKYCYPTSTDALKRGEDPKEVRWKEQLESDKDRTVWASSKRSIDGLPIEERFGCISITRDVLIEDGGSDTENDCDHVGEVMGTCRKGSHYEPGGRKLSAINIENNCHSPVWLRMICDGNAEDFRVYQGGIGRERGRCKISRPQWTRSGDK